MRNTPTDEDQSIAGRKREITIQLAAIVFSDQSIEARERAFAMLMGAAPDVARAVATLASLISPDTAPLWQAIMDGPDKAAECQSRACVGQRPDKHTHGSERALAWGAEDARDTADGIATRMGWTDVETEGEK